MPRAPDEPTGVTIAGKLRAQGFKDPRVLEVISSLPRERFVPPESRSRARQDRAISIGFEQTISQPYMVAVMTRELELTGTERVLEIGTGSGYQTAVLSKLAAEVFTIERLPTLSLRARAVLDGIGIDNVRFMIGDGSLGWPGEAPFDRIIVTAASPRVPRRLGRQLAEGGTLVAPIGTVREQLLDVITKVNGELHRNPILTCRFVKLIGVEGWKE
ncbi:MAG: protein-L-isoaspartate(D-aspartate) O-methyltransferase [Isosphaeraceae bacterium]